MYAILLTISLLFAVPVQAQLTPHQIFHLRAAIAESEAHLARPLAEKIERAREKGIKGDYDAYLRKLKRRARALIALKAFPAGLEASDIHDHIEDNTKVHPE